MGAGSVCSVEINRSETEVSAPRTFEAPLPGGREEAT